MEFLDKVSEEECKEIKNLCVSTIPATPDNWTCHRVKVSKNDFLQNIYIIIQGNPQNPIGWEKFVYDPCLRCYSQQVYDSGYRISDELMNEYPILQTENFDEIKRRAENFSRKKMVSCPLLYMANKKTGPYMVLDSVRRHIAAYIHYFILENEEFEPISENVFCMIPNDKKFNEFRIPTDFC